MRLSRGGSKKRPYYKIVVADARAPRDGKFIERIGSYNPQLPKDSAERMILDAERAKHWLAAGAQPSDRVARFLDLAGVKERNVKSNPNKGEPGQNAKDRAEDKATKLAEAEDAAAAAATPVAPPATAGRRKTRRRRSNTIRMKKSEYLREHHHWQLLRHRRLR
jgi:small subunit ribosomal protein S16